MRSIPYFIAVIIIGAILVVCGVSLSDSSSHQEQSYSIGNELGFQVAKEASYLAFLVHVSKEPASTSGVDLPDVDIDRPKSCSHKWYC